MPCRVELSEAELEAARRARTEKEIAKVVEPLQERNDALTHENDQLREAILDLIEKRTDIEGFFDEKLLKKIQKNQVEHRKEDLRRLENTFRESMWALIQQYGKNALEYPEMKEYNLRLMKVQEADPTQPLEPQLGFDPDEF